MTVWNLGSINIDHTYHLPHLPRPGETLSARDYRKGLGGKGANQSLAAARAGASVVHLGAAARSDDWVVGRLTSAGVDTTHIVRHHDQATGHAIILLDDDGENSIVIHGGANRTLQQEQFKSAIARMKGRDFLLMQNETNLQVELAQVAAKRAVRVVYSAAPFDIEALRAVLPHVSIIAVNEGEAAELTAAFGEDLAVEGMLITRGAKGAEYRDLRGGRSFEVPAYPVEVVDTTGAGDCFAGYFIAGLDRGDDIPVALRRAAAAAALKVTRSGAGDAIPKLDEVEQFLASKEQE
ncbi:ribokinase [Paracoccus zhejiangensis]|uniref:Ribokinase n=1 Tax=Paracoccus zhejiangensis TaxID=1077935 RepID=A0A2H5F0A1_9RHOB|nr:ribokinase [Paracoccus zhejiangensis]AUH64963.1 ribokinase [Paracoccus zhejiangensis]